MDLTFFPVLADGKACLAQHLLPRSIILFILQVLSNFVLFSFHYYGQGVSFLYKNGIVYLHVEMRTVPKPVFTAVRELVVIPTPFFFLSAVWKLPLLFPALSFTSICVYETVQMDHMK